MTAQTPAQAAEHTFVTGCVQRGITASMAVVPPEGQFAPVRGLWADVAQAAIDAWQQQNAEAVARTSRAIREALGSPAAVVAPVPDPVAAILRVIDETPHTEFVAIARGPQPASASQVRRHAVQARAADDADGTTPGLRRQLAEITRERDLLARWLGPGAVQAALSGREPRDVVLDEPQAAPDLAAVTEARHLRALLAEVIAKAEDEGFSGALTAEWRERAGLKPE